MKELPYNPELQYAELSQIDAASHQINRAINLVLSETDYISAVTLACAAESMLGEHLQQRGISSMTNEIKASLHKLVNGEISIKMINDDHVNKLRNFLKHAAKDITATHSFALDHEAIIAIVRAVGNFAIVTNEVPTAAPQFFAWLREKHPDLVLQGAAYEL